jgi:hypothetical protein
MHKQTLEQSIAELVERAMSGAHRAAIGRAHRGTKQKFKTKSKISKSLVGKPSNFVGKKHTPGTKTTISVKRGHRDPIGNKRWIVNSREKTYRKAGAPEGFKLGHRRYESFIEFIEQNDL